MKLEDYISEIKSMRRAVNKGQYAPHKPVLLLAVLELFRRGHYLVNRITPDSDLSLEYMNQWKKHVPEESPFHCVLAMPYFHIGREPFWKLVPSKGYTGRSDFSTMDAIRRSFEYAKLDDDLYFYFCNESSRSIIEKEIISYFFSEIGHDAGVKVEQQEASPAQRATDISSSRNESSVMKQASLIMKSEPQTISRPHHFIPATHNALGSILDARNITSIQNPIWKMKISDQEYDDLKAELKRASLFGNLDRYCDEAAVYYAEWWRREYAGGFPSKELVAKSADIDDPQALYMAARTSLERHRFKIISVSQRREYFRTMLGQGGIPVNYLKSGSNFSSYSAFLRGLVRELSLINYDWNEGDSSIVQELNCISRLARSFQNESIYDISIQIAHAIIMEDNDLLPYDSDDRSLSELTKGLKREYERAKTEGRIKPLTLNWKLSFDADSQLCNLYYSLDPVKEIGSESIPGLSPDSCFAFDVIMAGKVVAKYSRSKMETDYDTGTITRAIYSRINLGVSSPVLWKGEQIVDVKVRCDDGSRLFLVLPGSCPPDFTTPQSFQLIEGTVYSRMATANKENNLALFTPNWRHEKAGLTCLAGIELGYLLYSETVELIDSETGDAVSLQNDFTPYSVEYADTYVDWIESANYKICTGCPRIRVFDEEKSVVSKVDTFFRMHGMKEWKRLLRSSYIPQGLVQFKVIFPDGHFDTESFYCIGKLGFTSSESTVNSALISCHDADWARVEMETSDSLTIQQKDSSCWLVSKSEETDHTHTCSFRLYKAGMPALRIEMPLPFVGISIINAEGEAVQNRKVISYSNLLNFRIVCQGQVNPVVSVSYDNGDDNFVSQKIDCPLPDGITPLSDFSDAYDRMFNFYAPDSFSRKESVRVAVGNMVLYIRKFVLESDFSSGVVSVIDRTAVQKSGRFLQSDDVQQEQPVYKGLLLAFPLSDSISAEDLAIIPLKRPDENKNDFVFPYDFPSNRAIVFSDAGDRRKIVPKFYYVGNSDDDNVRQLSLEERNSNRATSLATASSNLFSQDILTGDEWKLAYKCFGIAGKYGLPFKTFTTLWAIGASPELTAKFILGMWYSGNSDVLVQDISSFEQEFVIGIHWIRYEVWKKAIDEFMDFIDMKMTMLMPVMMERLADGFVTLLRNVLIVTTGPESADSFTRVVSQGMCAINKKPTFMLSELNEIKSKVVGATDGNRDLPKADLPLHGDYYPNGDMKYYYRMMIHAPICAAEYFSAVPGCLDLWGRQNIEQRRVINYYRHYFRNEYSKVLLRALGIIANQR